MRDSCQISRMTVSLRVPEISFGFCESAQSSDGIRSSTIICSRDERTGTSISFPGIPYHRQCTDENERMAMTFENRENSI